MSTAARASDPAWFRHVLGRYPTGVCAITAMTATGAPAGMAVGTFTSISLEPQLVGFLPAKSSTSWPAIRDAGRFCANVLAADQEHVCRALARKGGEKFTGFQWRLGDHGSPLVDGAIAWIDCDMHDVVETGDHYFVIASVKDLGIGRPNPPLIFCGGHYGGANLPVEQ